ncbi:DivIVA domain-containing protein [Deinococcus sp. QL22]|uniref:DivIVA domain-containing protein n=1 Tax=Deinococcus sp. QL22 TaxID=2939437 RepID=UPI0020175B94|nr:DivIVA domain-containing protein [Deinococcus sp. QL22]UQN05831.1 DivIVA domain-containing protein [Deinococcus sp. QL22]
MKLSPLDIRHREFPGKFGGYDRLSVRQFLTDVAEELEGVLQERQAMQERTQELERRIEEMKQQEDEIRRTLVAAERMGHDLRETAARESEVILAQANVFRDAIHNDAQARNTELEAAHQSRISALELAFRGRFADLEREQHQLILERERAQAERMADLERIFSDRHSDLTARLASARQEYAQFLSGYRALVSSFGELSARHILPEESAPLERPPLPTTPLPTIEPGLPDVPDAMPEAHEPPRIEEQQFL